MTQLITRLELVNTDSVFKHQRHEGILTKGPNQNGIDPSWQYAFQSALALQPILSLKMWADILFVKFGHWMPSVIWSDPNWIPVVSVGSERDRDCRITGVPAGLIRDSGGEGRQPLTSLECHSLQHGEQHQGHHESTQRRPRTDKRQLGQNNLLLRAPLGRDEHTHTYPHTCTYTNAHTHTQTERGTQTVTHISTYKHPHAHICIHSTHMHKYSQTHPHRYKHAQIQTHTHTQVHTKSHKYTYSSNYLKQTLVTYLAYCLVLLSKINFTVSVEPVSNLVLLRLAKTVTSWFSNI